MQVNPVSQVPSMPGKATLSPETVKDPAKFQKMLQNMIKSNDSPEIMSQKMSQMPIDFARFLTPKEMEKLASKLLSPDLLGLNTKSKKKAEDLTKNVPYLGAMTKEDKEVKGFYVGQVFPEDQGQNNEQVIEDNSEEDYLSQYVSDEQETVTPFQFFLDKSLDFFGELSVMERRTDQLMVDYVEGRMSLEELTIEKAKVSVGLTFAVTITSQVQQAFNQITTLNI